MSIFSKLFSKAEEKEIDVDEALKEAFRSGESVDSGERQKAIRLYANVLHKSPATRVAWFNTGVIQSRMGNWQEAVRSFTQAQDDPEIGLVAAFARLKLKVEKGQQISDADFPQEFRGEKRGALGVQGPCHNAANELRNRGYTCTLDERGKLFNPLPYHKRRLPYRGKRPSWYAAQERLPKRRRQRDLPG